MSQNKEYETTIIVFIIYNYIHSNDHLWHYQYLLKFLKNIFFAMLPYSNIQKTSLWSVDTIIAWVGRNPIAGLKTKL